MKELNHLTFELEPKKSNVLQYGYLVLRDKEGKQLRAYRATSGQPNYQASDSYKIKGKGMCPPGDFKLYKGFASNVPGVVGTNGKGHFFPIEGNAIKAVGRSAIGLHLDGRNPGSAGCLVIENSDSFWEIHKILIQYFNENNVDNIPLKVIYKSDKPAPSKTITKIDKAGIDFIKKWEGFRSTSYLDSVGIYTVGYGSTRINGRAVKKGDVVTLAQAESLLMQDINEAQQHVVNLVKVPLTQNQLNVLVSFTYNCGSAAFADSTLLKKLNSGDYKSVPAELKRWVKGDRGEIIVGLFNRRSEEAMLWNKSVTPL